ncbi:alpha-galactosidase [Curtobacterium sp. Leaf261]|uniref:alpha-galactosidase n=1 Tax=Curtobacterium sp. Leaf261 TaxID=1736311 RepID=UPI0007019E10|nr:alpha-galactosidase [Curtobacterium sp. Leaf261]KQO60390.1 alpha-galactosidase [Curtobacterium sp. Leaf261]
MTTQTPTPTPDDAAPDAFVHLRQGGVSLLLDLTGGRLPAVVHWGADLGRITVDEVAALAEGDIAPLVGNVVDEPIRLALLPEAHTGWMGKPGVTGHRDGRDWSPLFRTTALQLAGGAGSTPSSDGGPVLVEDGAALVRVLAEDTGAGLTLAIDVEMLSSGLVRVRATIGNIADPVYSLDGLTIALPIPGRAREVLDFAGRWGKERTPQRRPLGVGIHEREGRKGRTGADAATVLSVGTPGFGFADGEVWGVHVAFSGNHRHYAERLFTGAQVVGGGELLLPGEVRLGAGESYASPWVYGAYGVGLDDQARRFHRWLRSRPNHPSTLRPMTINVWEAVYFDHDLARLVDLADRAAALGVERYVLDDGWFRGRRNDFAGLGDWFVDETVWPDGLTPLVEHVRGLGMEFGLWFEPEMVNEDSDLAREHPDWIMQTGGRLPVRSRHQQVLDLAIPEAYEFILGRIATIVDEYGVDYIKWDHNRDLVEAGGPSGSAAVHAQTLATYRLMGALKERFPGLEIESCSSGGARVDLGILEHTDRVWVSDCIDPLERQQMNRWTMQLLPPELLGSHIASGASHTTGRAHELSFRAGTALFGHMGIEWDLATATDTENAALVDWIALYKQHRELMHTGDLVRVDQSDDTQLVYGVVDEARQNALFFLAVVARSEVSPRGRITFPGLDPETRYRVAPVLVGEHDDGLRPPAWWHADAIGAEGASTHEPGVPQTGALPAGASAPGTVVSGRALATVGLQAPATFPERVVVFTVRAE